MQSKCLADIFLPHSDVFLWTILNQKNIKKMTLGFIFEVMCLVEEIVKKGLHDEGFSEIQLDDMFKQLFK